MPRGRYKGNGGSKGSYGSEYYESSGMPESGRGRRKTKKVPKGAGLFGSTTSKIRARQRLLDSL